VVDDGGRWDSACWVYARARGRSRAEVMSDGGARAYLLPGEEAGGCQGCQSHGNLQFSCSFFLRGEGTPNGRPRERAGRLDIVDVVWEEPDGVPGEIAAAGGNCVGATT
jgi:hypothetical protein